jgi:hypothetical protein
MMMLGQTVSKLRFGYGGSPARRMHICAYNDSPEWSCPNYPYYKRYPSRILPSWLQGSCTVVRAVQKSSTRRAVAMGAMSAMRVSPDIVLTMLMIKVSFERARRREETGTPLCQSRTWRNRKKGWNDHVVATRRSCPPRLICLSNMWRSALPA